jgi:hypothetical protein
MIPFSGRSVVASSAQEAALQSGPPRPVGTVRRLVPPSVEPSVRWGASLLHHRRHVTANLVPDLDDGLFRQTPGTMIQIRSLPASQQRLRLPDVGNRGSARFHKAPAPVFGDPRLSVGFGGKRGAALSQ